MSLSARELAELSCVALAVADEAAAILCRGHRSRPNADEKGRADLVTEFDRRSEAHVMARLAALTPSIPVIGEEQASAAQRDLARRGMQGALSDGLPAAASAAWYVDPLDGTTNFVHGHPFFCVSIGLLAGGEPACGAVVAPVLGLRYRGFQAPGGAGEALRNGERCEVSPIATFSKSLVATGFPPNRDAWPGNNFGSFIEAKRGAQAVRRCGAAAIDLCFVADGTYEGFWERHLHTWDVCAAAAMILAAGGRITSLHGGAMDYRASSEGRTDVANIVASNGKIHDELVSAIVRGEAHQLISAPRPRD